MIITQERHHWWIRLPKGTLISSIYVCPLFYSYVVFILYCYYILLVLLSHFFQLLYVAKCGLKIWQQNWKDINHKTLLYCVALSIHSCLGLFNVSGGTDRLSKKSLDPDNRRICTSNVFTNVLNLLTYRYMLDISRKSHSEVGKRKINVMLIIVIWQ